MPTSSQHVGCRTRKLDRDSGLYIRASGNGDVYLAGNALRGWLGDDVKQNLANLSRAGSDRVPLFVLERIDLPIYVKGANYWCCVHLQKTPYNRR